MPNDGNNGSTTESSHSAGLPSAAAAFAELSDESWKDGLFRNPSKPGKKGEPPSPGHITADFRNILDILTYDWRWKEVIAMNAFSGLIVKRRTPPFQPNDLGEWMDVDDTRLKVWLSREYGLIGIRSDNIREAVSAVADANQFHEVKDYLNGLRWDGVQRVKYWLHAYMGASLTPYTESAGKKFLISAVVRILRHPSSVKVDTVLILEGEQGTFKSTALKALFSPWFTDSSFEIGSKDGYQIIQGMWGVELAELDGLNRAEASRSKAFFSRDTDRYRNPYGHKPVNVVRQCVFAGSVNHATYLKDDTGNRRYWPVACGDISIKELREDRDQLWAEAVDLYRKGETWWVGASEKQMFTNEQDARYISDAYESRIRRWLDEPDVSGKIRDSVRSDSLLGDALGLDVAKWTLAEQQRVGRIMARVGWPRMRVGTGSREWIYCRPGSEAKS